MLANSYTYTQADTVIAILSSPTGDGVINSTADYYQVVVVGHLLTFYLYLWHGLPGCFYLC